MSKSLRDQVVGIIAEQALLDPESITDEASLEDLGIDSLGLVEAVFAIEETFDISVPFNANDPAQSDFNISSVKSIVEAVESIVAAKGD